MDKLIEGFSLLGLVSMAVGIVVLSALVRRLLELVVPSLVKDELINVKAGTKTTQYGSELSRWYNELFLYVLPYLVGSLIALSKAEFLFGIISTYMGRFILSMMVATFSAMVYKTVRKAIPNFFGVSIDADDGDTVLTKPSKE